MLEEAVKKQGKDKETTAMYVPAGATGIAEGI